MRVSRVNYILQTPKAHLLVATMIPIYSKHTCVTHSTNLVFVSIFADMSTTHGFLPVDWKSLTVVAQLGTFGSVHYTKYEGNEKSVVFKKLKNECSDARSRLLEKQRCFSV